MCRTAPPLLLTITWLFAGSPFTLVQSEDVSPAPATAIDAGVDVVELLDRQNVDPDPWQEPALRRLAGEIVSLDASLLVLTDGEGQTWKIPAMQVGRVEPNWDNEAARSARRLIDDKQYRRAVEEIPEALKSGLPRWQQQLLIAELVAAAEALGNPRTAGILFLNLAASQPPALLYAVMPLNWTSEEPDPAMVQQGLQWLASEDESARLLGASWLLGTEHRGRAATVLGELKGAKHPVVAAYAVAQMWRLTPPPETLGKLGEWMAFRDRLLSPLQLGLTELLADRLGRVSESELAIGQWMRIAAMHGDRYHRAARALEAAAAQLRRVGREDEAQRLNSWIEELRGAAG